MISKVMQQSLSILMCAFMLVLGVQPANAFQDDAGQQPSATSSGRQRRVRLPLWRR